MINIYRHPFRLFPKTIMDWNKKQALKDNNGELQGTFGDGLLGNDIPINHHKEISILWWLFVIEY
jgi:hypothetical protein